jgi:sterol desaturase/sphingolipid hydroxylase (fatty acid hydroxylase superfamily)
MHPDAIETVAPVAPALGRALVRHAYLPLMLLGLNGAAIAVVAGGAPPAWLVPLLLVAIGLSFAVERILPYEAAWNRERGDGRRDVLHAVVNEASSMASVALLPLLAGTLTLVDLWPRSLPFAVQVVGAIVVMDLGITLAHFASHKIGLLWRLHAVHHSVTRFYGLNGLMKHPLHQALEMVAGVTPLILIGLPIEVATVLAFATAIQLLLQHSNADYAVGPLGRVLALNVGHRFHHLKWAGIGDVNFGLFTHLGDHLLGTYRRDPSRRFVSEDLGIGKRPDYPVAYLAQLAEPFRRERGRAARRQG